jgi:hypothetical protein
MGLAALDSIEEAEEPKDAADCESGSANRRLFFDT